MDAFKPVIKFTILCCEDDTIFRSDCPCVFFTQQDAADHGITMAMLDSCNGLHLTDDDADPHCKVANWVKHMLCGTSELEDYDPSMAPPWTVHTAGGPVGHIPAGLAVVKEIIVQI